MLFSTVEFLFYFLPAAVGGFLLCSRIRGGVGETIWLILASLFFYAYWDSALLPLLLISIGVNFTFGHFLFANRSRLLLWMGLLLNVGSLGYFKYTGFLIDNFEAALGVEIANLNIVLPLAISFFTFQQIGYLVDVYRGRAVEPSFLNYVLFVSFFPQLISGPIVHHSEMLPQLQDFRHRWFRRALIAPALGFISIGLYKKVVLADGIAPVANQVFSTANTHAPPLIDAWTGAFAYTFQIYFDFSAYSDMAVGIALLFGIRLPLNFNSPYRATNIIDFWRRWHITLSRFIRDYIYIPLGGNRRSMPRRHVNLIVAMLIGGLWHGAAWTFVVWGGLHGLYLVINHLWRRVIRTSSRQRSLSAWAGRVSTLFVVVLAWVFFRADDFGSATRMLQGMFGGGEGAIIANSRTYLWLIAMLIIVWFMPNSWEMFRVYKPVIVPPGTYGTERKLTDFLERRQLPILAPIAAMLCLVSLLVIINRGGSTQTFIYMIF